MTRLHLCGSALLLAVSAGAYAGPYAGIEPYPAAVEVALASTVTRARVSAELQEALRLGLIRSGEGDFPVVTPAQMTMIANAGARAAGNAAAIAPGDGAQADDTVIVWGDPRLLRAKVRAETIEAARLGLLSFGEGDPPVATAAQEQQIAAAGRRAVEEQRSPGNVAHHAVTK